MQMQCVCRNTIRKRMEWTETNRYYPSSPSYKIGGHLQKTFVLVESHSKYMLFMRRLWKTKQNFNWISLNKDFLLCQITAHLVTQLPHFKHNGRYTFKGIIWKEQHPATPCKGCTSYRKISEIIWECENVWKASTFYWVIWKLSHIQNY